MLCYYLTVFVVYSSKIQASPCEWSTFNTQVSPLHQEKEVKVDPR